MLTQTIPSLVNALSGALPEPALRALTQALGNCNQPLSHRGSLNFSPQGRQETGPGYADGSAWNPSQYQDLLPDASSATGFDVPGWEEGTGWNTTNYGGDSFHFPVNQEFNLNNYYGGPNVYNAGDQYTNNQYTNNHTTNNIDARSINVQIINGQPVAGPAGPPGRDGAAGRPGEPGEGGGGFGPDRLPRRTDRIASYTLDPTTKEIEVVTGAVFDPDTCDIKLAKSVVKYVSQATLRQQTRPFTYYGP